MAITYREATLDDVDALIQLGTAFFQASPYHRLAPEGDVSALVGVVLTRGVVLVAESSSGPVDGERTWCLVGMLAFMVAVHPVGRFPFADEVCWYVIPEARAAGVGLGLLARFEDWGRAHAITMLKMAAPTGLGIERLYEAAGYGPLETAYIKRL